MVTYCAATEVKAFLQLPAAFSGSTNPTQTEVEAMITQNEGVIERETNHAWQSKTHTEEFHLQPAQYDPADGYAIFLSHRKIKTLDSGEGDVLTVWNGSTDEDYLASRTEGRNNDFWVDYNMGILHINTPFSGKRYFSVNITYRYGDTTVPGDIKKACVLLTAADLASSDDRSVLFPEGSSNVPLLDKVQRWKSEAYRILQKNKELVVIGGL